MRRNVDRVVDIDGEELERTEARELSKKYKWTSKSRTTARAFLFEYVCVYERRGISEGYDVRVTSEANAE